MYRSFLLALLPALAVTPAATAAQVVQPIPGTTDADRLAGQMRLLASNPTDLAALLAAGELSLKLDDLGAAASFFARAERVDPHNARAKAGQATILVHAERPGEALRYFATAEREGMAPAAFAADRGLAYDLIGEQERAQRDYRLALRTAPDDETLRRYGLSLGISGKRDLADQQLQPLIRKSDRGAWRARAFIEAMAGNVGEAAHIATTMMPPGTAAGLQPFFERLPAMGPVDRAFAVHFGEVRATPQRLADARLAPTMAALGPDPYAPRVAVAAVATAPERRDRKERKPKRPVEVAAAARSAPVAVASPANARPVAERDVTVASAPVRSPVIVAPRPVLLAAIAPPTPPPVVTLPQPEPPVVLAAAPLPPAAVVEREERPAATEPARRASSVTLAGIVDRIVIPGEELGIAAPRRPAAVIASPEPEPTPDPAEIAAAERAAKAKALADKKIADRKAAAEKKALAEKKAAAEKKAEEARAAAAQKKLERANPQRVWVQVAGGAYAGDLPKAWAAAKAKGGDAFTGHASGWTTPLRFTNRVLAGPFKTGDEARDFVNSLKAKGLSAFTFTSEAGQVVTKLPTK